MRQYERLTRRDLGGFDREQKALILAAMEAGAVGRVSTKGHAILRGTDGVSTASVSRKGPVQNRSAANVRASVSRLISAGAPVHLAPTKGEASVKEYACSTCGKEFDTAQARVGHETGAHKSMEIVRCPLCLQGCKGAQGFSNHMSHAHGIDRRRMSVQCAVCRRNVQGAHSWKLHMAKVHQRDVSAIDAPMPGVTAPSVARPPIREPAPVEAAPVEAAPVEAAPVEAAPAPVAPPKAPSAPMEAPSAPQAAPAPAPGTTAPRDAGDALIARLEHLAVEVAKARGERDDALAALALIREALSAFTPPRGA